MLVDLKLDTTSGDLALENYDLVLVAGVERIAQQILIRLKTFRGECSLDTQAGIPWREQIFVKHPDMPTIEALLKAEVLAVQGVTNITEFSSQVAPATRTWTVSLTAESAEGLVTITNQEI
jgi:hypothetical protein